MILVLYLNNLLFGNLFAWVCVMANVDSHHVRTDYSTMIVMLYLNNEHLILANLLAY